ncbi:ABC transporter substrate-binding protein [Candidatus Pelagibacter sp.]|nr:ABC transporter substrate-binding protein [Candidatus Pelagibacter sp.]
MKTGIKLIFSILLIFNLSFKALSAEKIKIGLLIPVTGEYGKIGQSVINSVRLALNSINDNRIEILPRDTRADPSTTLKIAKELYEVDGVKIIIGPLFSSSTEYLSEIPEVTFLSLTNKLTDTPTNVISTGVNSISQLNAIKKFQKSKNLERTIFLIPNSNFKIEIEKALSKTKIKLKDKFLYDTDPTLLTAQIEKITRYPQRKQNLLDEIERVENSMDTNKEKKIENLKKRDTIGGINFDSVVIADFDENFKSVATSLLYTDVSSKRVLYINLNNWFDESLLEESSLHPIYFPSVDKTNYDTFNSDYKKSYGEAANQISFLSYDIIGLVYYLIYKNDFVISNKMFSENNIFKGKTGIFQINDRNITHELSFYSIENKKFIKIF